MSNISVLSNSVESVCLICNILFDLLVLFNQNNCTSLVSSSLRKMYIEYKSMVSTRMCLENAAVVDNKIKSL